ncbi:MAG: DegT/DnrJ/EryC1/StrS family aminotransferase [Planctomycetes bacterium]|nr:DegT/DnrJ/EryC1/StrS family aminotransferase [Planctomycetota bacterium]
MTEVYRQNIRLSRSIVGQREADAVSRVIVKDGYLGMGEEVKLFEEDIAGFLGVDREWVICVNSGTAALHLAVEAVTQPGNEVLVQSLTFLSSFQAISAAKAVPIACEVLPQNVCIDLEDAKKRLSSNTTAIMPVHYASNPGDLDSVYEFADKHNLRVIEDAAHSFGCITNGKKIGSFGDISCFSFDGIKNITSGEGGAVVTSDQKAAQYIRDARLLGIEKDSQKRYSGQRSWEFEVHNQGYRYHMSNIMAAIGRVQLQRLIGEFAPIRKKLAGKYREILDKSEDIRFFETDPDMVIPHIQPIRILNGKRDDLRTFLEEQNIGTGIHYKPNHLFAYYGNGSASLPVTEMLYEELLSLPLHPGLSEMHIEYVCKNIKEFMSR